MAALKNDLVAAFQEHLVPAFASQTEHEPWTVADTPYPKRPDKLPVVLIQDEVARLIDAALTPHHRAVLMTLYASATSGCLPTGSARSR